MAVETDFWRLIDDYRGVRILSRLVRMLYETEDALNHRMRVRRLRGLSIDKVARYAQSRGCVLWLPGVALVADGITDGLARYYFDENLKKFIVSFKYRTRSHGDRWFEDYERDLPVDQWPWRPALIYSRNMSDKNVTIGPIVSLSFSQRGVCAGASATACEFTMRLRAMEPIRF